MADKITVTIETSKQTVVRQYPRGTRVIEIAEEFQADYEDDILLAKVNHKLRELGKRLKEDCTLSFFTYKDKCGIESYRRTATLLLLKAFHAVVGHKNIEKIYVDFSIGDGYFCQVKMKEPLTAKLVEKLKARMQELVEAKHPLNKRSLDTDAAVALFHRHGMLDKEKLFRFRRDSKANLYSLNGFEDYFYGYMVPDAGYIKYFDLILYHDGVVLQMPKRSNPKVVSEFISHEKLFETLHESSKWLETIDVQTVGALNEEIVKGGISHVMLVSEALQEKKIADIAATIASQKDKKFIMIAGPSSSGKTTFSHRLTIQLMANGLKPHPIPVDNYFVNRDDTPLDEDGKHDFECLEALDVEKFNQDMTALARGEEVELPIYNFVTGKREYKGETLKLGENDILVIEGIHCLNDKLSYALPKEKKFKIYISALTQLNIDEHNPISSTDGRLIRRMVRDARTRGTSAQATLARWPSVRRGEEKYIYPYQEEADVMFNSALVYELSVLKQFAEPLLFGIPVDSPEHIEAKRLLKFLDYFIGVDTAAIPDNSLLREFVGGGCFKV